MGPYAPSIDRVVAICRVLLERGYLKATEGNVSVRVPVRKAFAITLTLGKKRTVSILFPQRGRRWPAPAILSPSEVSASPSC